MSNDCPKGRLLEGRETLCLDSVLSPPVIPVIAVALCRGDGCPLVLMNQQEREITRCGYAFQCLAAPGRSNLE